MRTASKSRASSAASTAAGDAAVSHCSPSPLSASRTASRTSRWSSATRTRAGFTGMREWSARSGRRSTGLEVERRGVHAVPQPRRLGPVVEDVSEVRAAALAEDLRARHEEAAILVGHHALLGGGRPEARPSRSRIEFRLRLEELVAARRAEVVPERVLVPVLARESALRALLAQNAILLGSQRRAPLRFRLLDRSGRPGLALRHDRNLPPGSRVANVA